MCPTDDILSRTCEHCKTVFKQSSNMRRHQRDSQCQRSRVPGPPRFSARHPRPDPFLLREEQGIGELVSSHPCVFARWVIFAIIGSYSKIYLRYKISKHLGIPCRTAYPILNNCYYPGQLPCPTKDPDSRRIELLLAARNHDEPEISVPKKGKWQVYLISMSDSNEIVISSHSFTSLSRLCLNTVMFYNH